MEFLIDKWYINLLININRNHCFDRTEAKLRKRLDEARLLKVAMTHIATQEELNGKVVDWMEKVSDEQYQITKSK